MSKAKADNIAQRVAALLYNGELSLGDTTRERALANQLQKFGDVMQAREESAADLPPATHDRDQLVAICRHLAKHYGDDPAVTFDNAPGLVQSIIEEAENAHANLDKMLADDADLYAAAAADPKMAVNEDYVTARLSRILASADNSHEEFGEALVARAQRVVDALHEARANLGKLRHTEPEELSILRAFARSVARQVGAPRWAQQCEDRDSLDATGKLLASVVQQGQQTKEASVPVSELRALVAVLSGYDPSTTAGPEHPLEEIKSLVVRLQANQKPEGFEQAAQTIIDENARLTHILESVGHLLKLK